MFKDYDKYLSASLKVYLFVLFLVFIMKLVGLDYFGININNQNIINISNYLSSNRLGDIVNFTILYIQFYFYLCIVCDKKKLYVYSLIATFINWALQFPLMSHEKMDLIYYILSFSIMLITPMIVNRKIFIKRQIKYILIITFYQFISLFIRNVGFNYTYGNFLIDVLLNIDQLLLLAITYNLHFMKGEVKKWEQELEAGLSLLKKINLKNLLKKLQENLHKFRELPKQQKLSISIYIFLSIIWNTLSLLIILLVARLNHTLIECLFILTSFWLSKHAFGKPFHLSSMMQCFIISNLTYYTLNRITTPLGISIFIPILLGVGLSYITSKLVKKTYKPLYRGMPKDLFEETILKIVDKNSIKYKICYEFYIDKKSDLSLSFKYNYSIAGIRKIKDRINDKIKGLN